MIVLCQLQVLSTVHWVNLELLIRPWPIMHFKLPIMLLSNAPNLSLLCPSWAPLCFIMLHKFIKFLLSESENNLKATCRFGYLTDCSIRVYRSFAMDFWKLLAVFKCYQIATSSVHFAYNYLSIYYHNPTKLAPCLSSNNNFSDGA